MGCWNFTCGLTGLPIHSDDPVVAMMIRDDGYGRLEGSRRDLTPSYPWQMFSPASLLVRGTYNDYGFIDATDEQFAKMMLAETEARRISIDVPIERDGETVYGFGNKTLDAAYSVDDDARYKMRDLPFTIWMAHASVYDRFLEEMTYEDHHTGWKPVTIKSGVQKALAKAIAKHQDTSGSMFDTPWSEGSSTFVGAAVSYIGHRMQVDAFARNPEFKGKEDRKLSPEEFEMLTSAWADLKALYFMMECLRVTLVPCGACGSQDGDLAPYKLRNLAINDVMAAREKKQGEWDAEYGDEEEDEDGAEATA